MTRNILLIYMTEFTVKCPVISCTQTAHDTNSTGAIVKNLASNVNLSYYMDLWTLGSKLQKNSCWTFFK